MDASLQVLSVLLVSSIGDESWVIKVLRVIHADTVCGDVMAPFCGSPCNNDSEFKVRKVIRLPEIEYSSKLCERTGKCP